MPAKFEQSKNWFWIILDVALVVLVALMLLGGKSLLRFSRSLPPAKSITVSSEGKVTVVPDLATVNFSVIAEGTDPTKLQNENNQKIDSAIAYIKSQGVDAKDIKTTGYNLNPKYIYNQKTGKSSIDGYTLTQSVEIKIRDFSKISPILGSLPSKGVNDINGPRFSVDDPDKFLNQAREEAFTKAKAKAAAMAGYAEARLGRVVTFSESSGGYPIYYDRFMEASVKGGGPVAPPMPTIEPGSQEVTVNVNVTYEIW